MTGTGFLSLLPPLAAILLAFVTRRVLVSLSAGVLLGVWILCDFSLIRLVPESVRLMISTVMDPGNAAMLLFSLLIGALVFVVERSGGVRGFVRLISRQRFADTPRKAGLLTAGIGTLLFVEGSMSILTVGTVARPLFRKFGMSHAKLAYVADATCAPVAVLIPLNGWGAYLMTQLSHAGTEDPAALLLRSFPFFFYPMAAVVLGYLSVLVPLNFGSMKKHETAGDGEGSSESADGNEILEGRGSAIDFMVPIGVLIGTLFFFLFLTGHGSLIRGDGAVSILGATMVALMVSFFLCRLRGVLRSRDFFQAVLDGIRHLAGVVAILALAFAINTICRNLGTGTFAAGILQGRFPVALIPAAVFIVSGFVSFATGTSWGTFAIMLGVALPLAVDLGLSPALLTGAVVSGGVWGDHCSPVSDTTVLASLASDCPLMVHVQTQLPYAFAGGGLALLLFLAAGWL